MLDRAPWVSDASERERLAGEAIAIGKRHRDRGLEFSAMALLGDAYVASGRVDEGMTMLDQAMAGVIAGEVTGVGPVGEIYCRLLSACERATDLRRAEQWLETAMRFEAWGDFVPPTCRTHYGGILIALGRWEEAEHELLAAIRRFETGYRAARLFPLLRLAELRARQGRMEEAERLLDNIDWHAGAKRTLATIAFARGDLDLAGDLVRLCLETTSTTDPECPPLLAVLVDVQLARGDRASADETLDQLTGACGQLRGQPYARDRRPGPGPRPAARGDEEAWVDFREAQELFSERGLMLEGARARAGLARALATHAPAAAVGEARVALATFERLGASHDADSTAALLRELGARDGASRGPTAS